MRSSADRRADTSSGCADGHVEAGPPSPARLVYGCAERAAPRRSNLQCRAPDYESRRFLLTRNTTKSAMKTAIVAKKMVISHLLTSMIVGQVFVRIRVRHRSPSVENRCSPRRLARSAGNASRTTAAACSPARYPHSERHHKGGNGGRSVALIPSAPCVQTHRRVSSARPAPPAAGVRLALPQKAAPEDLPPRSWVASAQLVPSGPVVQTTRCRISVSMAFYGLTTSTDCAVRMSLSRD